MEPKIFWSTQSVEGVGRTALYGAARPTLNLMGDWSSDELTSKPEKIRA